jgi:YMGG-like Gly-zipper
MKITVVLVVILLHGTSAFSQYIYPSKGQSAQQQDRDRYECHTWAVQQTGFDPTKPQATQAQSAPPPGKPVVKGAARGAAVGAVGGAIAGDAGRGAAAGAAMGGLLGGMKRMDQAKAQSQQQAQQQNISAQQQDGYNRALGVCLQGRGYTVG